MAVVFRVPFFLQNQQHLQKQQNMSHQFMYIVVVKCETLETPFIKPPFCILAYARARARSVHHKFTDTDADPHNVSRGLFFAHMGWLLVKKHPDVRAKGSSVDMSDLEKDAFVMFQKK